MKFLLIRHGQSENNARPEAERVHDPSLTPLGQQQAVQVAEALSQLPLTRLIVSPFRRTLLTAWPTIQAIQLPTEIWVEVHERGGCYRGYRPDNICGQGGMARQEILKQFPGIDIPEEVDDAGWWRSQDRETNEEAQQRVERAIAKFESTFQGQDEFVAVFTHADFKSIFAATVSAKRAAAGSVAADDPPTFPSAHNGGISHYAVDESGISLVQYNVVDHLATELYSS